MNITITQAKASLGRVLKDISDVSNDDIIEWSNFANRQFYNFINGIDPERFVNQVNTFTVSSIPQTSALPSDFMNVQPLGCGFFEIDSNGDDTERVLPRTGFGSRQIGFYIKGTNVVFTGINDGTQFRLRYIPLLTTLTDLSDSLILDEIYLQAFRNDLETMYQHWDAESGLESLADFRFVRTLEELGDNIKREASAYSIPDTMSNY